MKALITAMLIALAAPAFAADEIHWTVTGPSTATIDWRGTDSVVVVDGTNVAAHAPSVTPRSGSGPWREADITNLTPGVPTPWQIGDASGTVAGALPRGSSGFVVDAIGDVGDSGSYKWVVPIASMIAADHPAFVLMVGDLTYANAHGQAHCDQHFNDVQKWSLTSAYMPAWGNHEWDSSGDDMTNYKGRFALPNARAAVGAPSAGGKGEDWYWFDYGNARFIAYPEPFSGAWAAWAKSADSLMAQVDADPQIKWIVTFGHRPAYSTGHHPGDATLAGYMNGMGDRHPKYVLNLNGHSHDYERTKPQHGVTHVTTGGGGSSLETDGTLPACEWYGKCPPPAWSAFRAMHHGVLRMHFADDGIALEFIAGPPDAAHNDVVADQGAVMDSYPIGAGPPPPPPPPPPSARYYIESGFQQTTPGAIFDRTTGRLVSLQDVAKMLNAAAAAGIK